MKKIKNEVYVGERCLFKENDVFIEKTIFEDGESPLKESHKVELKQSIFKWKYPLWYSTDITMDQVTLLETARSGIWYTRNLVMKNSVIEAPKTFRRATNLYLDNVKMPNAKESFWNCENIELAKVDVSGDYFAMNSQGIKIRDFTLTGNYGFDGCRDIEIENAQIISKDAFWNCENVVVKNSLIIGEYLGWNSNNITFINCTIESEQGMCYMENLELVDCTLLHTDLAFEYSNVQAKITSEIESVKNPYGGKIICEGITELIMDDSEIEKENTVIEYIS